MTDDRPFADAQYTGCVPYTAAVHDKVVYLFFHTVLICFVSVAPLEASPRTVFVEAKPALITVFALSVFTDIVTVTVGAANRGKMFHAQ